MSDTHRTFIEQSLNDFARETGLEAEDCRFVFFAGAAAMFEEIQRIHFDTSVTLTEESQRLDAIDQEIQDEATRALTATGRKSAGGGGVRRKPQRPIANERN